MRQALQMFAMPRLRLLVAVIGAAAFATLIALVAFSPSASANHSWSNYHWARADKANLKLGDNVSQTNPNDPITNWDTYLQTAAGATKDSNGNPVEDGHNDWDKPAKTEGYTFNDKLDPSIVAGGTNPAECKPTNGQVEVCNASYGSNGWLGLAQIWVSSSHITAGTTKLNDTYFNTAKYNTAPWRNLVMCQEVGHDFGLSHTDETFSNTNLGSCMDYTNDPDGGGFYGADNQYPGGVANKRELRNNALPYHDYDQLRSIYTHSDSSTTIGANTSSKLPPQASERAFNRLEQLGERIHRSPDGRIEIYRLNLGNGNELISRVVRP
jgi:hypothetical protein